MKEGRITRKGAEEIVCTLFQFIVPNISKTNYKQSCQSISFYVDSSMGMFFETNSIWSRAPPKALYIYLFRLCIFAINMHNIIRSSFI